MCESRQNEKTDNAPLYFTKQGWASHLEHNPAGIMNKFSVATILWNSTTFLWIFFFCKLLTYKICQVLCVCVRILSASLVLFKMSSIHSLISLCPHPLSQLLYFLNLIFLPNLRNNHQHHISPRATFQWKAFIYNTTSFPARSPSSFAGKLLISPTSPRSQPTRSVASPAKCWQCELYEPHSQADHTQMHIYALY